MNRYHFIGLGGIGMSAIARILLQRGHKVQGSDMARSALLDQLASEGAVVQIGHDARAVQEGTTVVYSSGVQEDNVELQQAKKIGAQLLHRSEMLNLLTEGKRALLVTGTHGKTTTTALLSAVLMEAKADPSFVIGGLLQSLKTNGKAGEGAYFIAEADESDGSFLKTCAYGAIVTNLEDDHLDYWKTGENLEEGFRTFFAQALHPRHLFWCGDDRRLQSLSPPGVSYGFSSGASLRIASYQQTETGICFNLEFQGALYEQIELCLFGKHNALNGAAVFGLALSLGISERAIRDAFRTFRGTHRRLEYKGQAHSLTLYDDYGHHPTEIHTTINALRDHILEKRLVVLFQPHRYTRVRDCWEQWPASFADADEVILTDIYAAGEKPIEGISSGSLYAHMREKIGAKLRYLPRASLEEETARLCHPFDVVLTIGAGDITSAGQRILERFQERAPKWTIALLCGGTSVEHPVSLMSARNIAKLFDPSLFEVKLFGITKQGEWIFGADAIDRLQQHLKMQPGTPKITPQILTELTRCDIAVPVLHGPQGEDGMIQGLLDALCIPYVGCDYRASALCMHKSWTKQIALLHHIPTARYFEMEASAYRRSPEALLEQIEKTLSYPVWIKPAHLGSSIGVSRAAAPDEAHAAAIKAFALDDVIIVEQEVDGKQIEFGLLGNEHIRIAECCEILNHGAFLAYDKKYGVAACPIQVPAQISDVQRQIGRELAEGAYRASGCKGLARIDFFLDKQGHFWLNEINPFPGFTDTSAYPKMWEASGMNGSDLVNEWVILAMHRNRRLLEIRGRS